jgi:hypothetical protein
MASKGQQTGMRGVFLVAAELSARGFVVSTTSRNAMGADLLVTDRGCSNVYSVQVKTNAKPSSFWLVGPPDKVPQSVSHVYVFVNLRGTPDHEYFVVPASFVAQHTRVSRRSASTWYGFHKQGAEDYREAWQHFGSIDRQPNER